MTTVTYDVPTFNGLPTLDRYGDHDGNALLAAVIGGDGAAINSFLASLALSFNARVHADDKRAAYLDGILASIADLVPKITLTGFKGHKEGKSWNAKLVVNEGEGCEGWYCDKAAKYRLPADTTGDVKDHRTDASRAWVLACQKHAMESLIARARAALPGDYERVYLASDQVRNLNDFIRADLAKVGK